MNMITTVKTTILATLCTGAITAMAAPASEWNDNWNDVLPYSRSLETVDAVVNALDGGATVNAAVDLSQCTRQDGGTPSETKGGLTVLPYRIQADGTLSFADSHFTVSTRSGTATPIMQFLRYTVAPEGAITVSSFIFSVPDYTLTSEVAFECTINGGVSFHAAY